MTVVELVDDNGAWNIQRIKWLPIDAYYGHFTIASAYALLCEYDEGLSMDIWKFIRQLEVPERVRSFVWLVNHGKLLTNERKSKMNLGASECMYLSSGVQ
ncbi:hypothetical protein A2U01_0004339 [Trifolium medium]|uniref:Reverse transcriptase zinc-binding domain-containing protein n=1 Tax=Trifolium medium TaxID=97028 RepID=A0A392M8S8_9FABA|nr:hypothetical protein [Trifolium medium]